VSDTADAQALVHRDAIERASTTLRQAFTPGQTAAVPPEQLPAHLEAVLGLGRLAWSLDVVRPLSDVLLEQAEGRRISSRHEARWLNLLGFCLRPGFGATLDDFRMGQARKVYLAGLAFPGDVQCQAEWLVLWQRLAGGLTAGQQQDIFHRLAQPLLASLAKKGRRLAPQVERETWRLLASLERIPPATRATLGDQLIARLEGQAGRPGEPVVGPRPDRGAYAHLRSAQQRRLTGEGVRVARAGARPLHGPRARPDDGT
jgi:hypothetical protein